MPCDPQTIPIGALYRNRTRLVDWSNREHARACRARAWRRLFAWRPWAAA